MSALGVHHRGAVGVSGAGVWVGPAAAPMSYELITVLGSDGESAVWRARHPAALSSDGAERDVAISIAPHRPDDPDWDEYAARIVALIHPGLVRVRDVFTSADKPRADQPAAAPTFDYVVMDYEPGLTLREWLEDHPEAPISERLALLRPIARAVDALHAAGGGLSHGAIRPDNIIIRADGSAVLVSIGRFRNGDGRHEANPFAAPEQRHPNARATAQGDSYSFAVTVLAAVTGQPLPTTADGWLDDTSLRDHLRRTTSTRRRPLLARHLTSTLHKPAESRLRPLRPWLDAPRRRCRIAVTAGVILVLLGTTGWAARPTPTATAAVAPSASPSASIPPALPFAVEGEPPATAATPNAVVAGAPAPDAGSSPTAMPAAGPQATDDVKFTLLDWPLEPSCDGTTSVAARLGSPSRDRLVSRQDVRRELIALGGGAWKQGQLHFLFTPTGGRAIRITSIILTRVPEAPPAWVFQPAAAPSRPGEVTVCGLFANRYKFGFNYDLDSGVGGPNFSELPAVPGGEYADITLRVSACRANYRWQLSVNYLVGGSASVRTYTDPTTFVSYGHGDRTPIYAGYQDGTGGIHVLADSELTGNSCNVGPLPVPTASPTETSTENPPSSAATAEPSPDVTVAGSPAPSPTATASSASSSRPSPEPTP